MQEAYHPISFVSKVFKKQDYLESNNKYSDFDSLNQIFFSNKSKIFDSEPIISKKAFQNRNYVDSVGQAMQDKFSKEDFISQNKRDYSSINYSIPKKAITLEEIKQKRNQKIVFGTDDVTKEWQNSEKQQQFRKYDIEEFIAKNDGSIFKLHSKANQRSHSHKFDFYNLCKNEKPISNYNQNYQQQNQLQSLNSNPFLNQEKLKTIEKLNRDNIQLAGFGKKDEDYMKSESMVAYTGKKNDKASNDNIYKQMINKRYHLPLILGTEKLDYEKSSNLPNQSIGQNQQENKQNEQAAQLRRSNFELGQEKFQDYKKNMEGNDKQAEFINQYNYNQELYKKQLNNNRFDSVVLGEQKNNDLISITKSELPQFRTSRYVEAKKNNYKMINDVNKVEDKDIFGSDFNKDYYKSEKQDQYQQYNGVRPNKLSALQEQSLRYSSIKFDDLKNPEFISINQSSFISPTLLTREKSILQANLENSVKKQPVQDYIFGVKNKDQNLTTNQELMAAPKNGVPNSLGDRLFNLKMSHFQLG
ncbi:hypothetical protein TTHERM_00732900 (macronuclear) [Tetrahymena thermophila SB210]|uniref:Uncharacterized protein n=1 Tax=Tetrahymena thermophila (strain SB210) TaxID=312017 RepID=Q245C1_TETTS|nr:hypothetical protein TTHERM_00732900 [Tetrahymena thermophila SB210]EAS03443.2 hypothetical protein TTHERM_00732900 [Tetrahymena thermophila SB210]|eukprot:XP_001023688.2 hypothetical protein TTHERM_00732900 [Tetrahymena thermophila SB210]